MKFSFKFGVGTLFAMSFIGSSQASCVGYACDGKDPTAEGCSASAITVASSTAQTPYAGSYAPGLQLRLELRWSPVCKTNWARLSYVTPPPFPRYDGLSTVSVYRSNDNRTVAYANPTPYNFNSIYSPMLYGASLCTRADGSSAKYIQGWYTTTLQTNLVC